MKKNTLLILLLILAVSAAMLLTACSKSSDEPAPEPVKEAEEVAEEAVETAEEAVEETLTLEKFIMNDEKIKAELDELIEKTAGLSIDIKDNDLIYYFDLAQMDYSEETARGAVSLLQEGLKNAGSTFAGVCQQMEDETGVEDVHTFVNYTWGDEILVTSEFTIDGIVE